MYEITAVHPQERVPPARPFAHVRLGAGMWDLGPLIIRDRAWLIQRLVEERYLRHEAKLMWDARRNAFYLGFTLDLPLQELPLGEDNQRGVVCLDPGVRRFQTFYDPVNATHGTLLSEYTYPRDQKRPVVEELRDRRAIVERWRAKHQQRPSGPLRPPSGRAPRRWRDAWLREEMSLREYKRRCRRKWQQRKRHARRREARAWARFDGYKTSMHYDSINFLWSHWSVVVPSTESMGRVVGSRLGRDVNRDANNWSHYAWRQRLVSSAGKGGAVGQRRLVLPTDEAYTTKTCGLCGALNDHVGGSTTFTCPACKVVIDRDVNGARNIALRLYTRLQTGRPRMRPSG